jgi:hypothetical protein
MGKKLTIITLLLTACLVIAGCDGDYLEYEGKKYVPVPFSQDLFACGFGMGGEFEVDETYPVECEQFDMIQTNGDLYVVKSQADEATSYYQDDTNYDWIVSIFDEEADEDLISPIDITEEELTHIYQLENQEKDLAIFFDEIQQQATLIKTSKDGVARGSMELALYEGKWYWRSGIIDDSREKDDTWPEYIYPMPDSFQNKIKL